MKRSRSDKLEAGQFRFLNEILYTTPSSESQEMFKKDPEYFNIYHRGFSGQMQSWPVNPLEVVEEEIRKILQNHEENFIITDLGCGLGQLELNLKDLPNAKVFSYDLVSAKDHVITCDISKLPLRKRKVDIAVFCLSLMGLNHVQMVQEAHRVLKRRGTLIVAEVSTRFSQEDLLGKMRILGFKSVKSLIPNSYFSVFIFQKVKPRDEAVSQLFEPFNNMSGVYEKKLDSVEYSFYTPEEAKSLGLVQIVSAEVYDSNKIPVPGGLADPAMGVAPGASSQVPCSTCAQDTSTCPGHLGYMPLSTVVFNPFTIDLTYKLLKSKCSYCHRLRITADSSRVLVLKSKLIKSGKYLDALMIEDLLSDRIIRASSDKDFKDIKNLILDEKEFIENLANECTGGGENDGTTASVKLVNEISSQMWKMFSGSVCPHCDLKFVKVKKEGDCKIVREGVKDKDAQVLNLKGVKVEGKAVVLTAEKVFEELRITCEADKEVLAEILNDDPLSCLFLHGLIVAPNRFRPESKGNSGTQTYFNVQTVSLLRILKISKRIEEMKKKSEDITDVFLELQHTINMYMDSANWSRQTEKDQVGIRQLLEKKEGLFRLKMMGKRVNYAARSVISPDPYINTGEIGIPVIFAKKLTFREPVRENNLEWLQKLVENGSNVHPGANMIENKDGSLTHLDKLSPSQLKMVAAQLYTGGPGKIVYRHLHTGDWLLVNRQPTLHKPSMMAHSARVLPKQTTIRMHYSNCNTYNADFDGDEINLHFFQSHLARAEAKYIAATDYQYTAPTSGKPLRGLIQDHVVSGVLLTAKDTFLDRDQYMQLVYIGTQHCDKIVQVPPCVLKPKELWSGKQVISTIIQALSQSKHQMNLQQKCKVSGNMWGPTGKEEDVLVIRQGYVCTGILDKNHIGNSEFGLVHSFHELYGEQAAAQLLTSFGRVLTLYLQYIGFSCSMDDLILKGSTNQDRADWANKTAEDTVKYSCEVVNAPGQAVNRKLCKKIESFLGENDNNSKELDAKMISFVNKACSSLQGKAMPKGLVKVFPQNSFSAMVTTGAKGSMVNHNQVSLMLGQQEIEGRRVPLTALGKSAPSFDPYDPTPRANGLISDRFLTGIKPQEFFFHCMAGREGLVDTAVKTSRSGYLQRCLIKGLESLVVAYDYSVRDSDGSIIQFLYGEDCIDPCKNKYVTAFDFLYDNSKSLKHKLKYYEFKPQINMSKFSEFYQYDQNSAQDTVLHKYSPCTYACLSSSLYKFCINWLNDKSGLRKVDKTKPRIFKTKFSKLVSLKYIHSLVQPGDAVGIIASQSIGEPSTQMTLNTFHLAGHGSVNVTLGIPRLREILMTAAAKIQTPTMTVPFKGSTEDAERFKSHIQKISFKDLVKKVKLNEAISPVANVRTYTVKIVFEDKDLIEEQIGISWVDIDDKVKTLLIPNIDNAISLKIKKSDIKTAVQVNQFENVPENTEPAVIKPNRSERAEEDGLKKKEMGVYENESDIPVSEPENMQIDPVNKEVVEYKCLRRLTKSDKLSYFKVTFEVPIKYNILVLGEIEKQLESTYVRELPGIGKCHVNTKGDKVDITTEGVNFFEMWKYSELFDLNRLVSNDIVSVLNTYGVEAAGKTIINEVNSIFNHYGISVDRRHLSLVSDFMTFNGGYRPFNRFGMNENPSSLLRMSYETTMNYLTESAVRHTGDPGKSPSACIVLGKPTKVGTNYMDVFQVLNN